MRRLLIEDGLPFAAINEASDNEKGGAPKGHPTKLHLWWARRPLPMSRAVVLGSLLPAPVDDAERRTVFQLITGALRLRDASNPPSIEPLRRLLAEAFPTGAPTVLDCFAGGGSIPLEALRLGCNTTAIDLNPVAHLIELCLLDYPQRFGQPDELGRNRLAEDVRHWSAWVGTRVKKALSPIYPSDPDEAKPVAWFWARTMDCQNPACGIEIPLVNSWWLARGRRIVRLQPFVVEGSVQLKIIHGGSREEPVPGGTVRGSSVTCPSCGGTVAAADVRRYGREGTFGVRLLAVMTLSAGKRHYRLPTEADLTALDAASRALSALPDLEDGMPAVPHEGPDPAQRRKFGMLPFGIVEFRQFFNDRQLVLAASLCEQTRQAHLEMLAQDVPPDYARAVATYIGLIIGRIVNFNSAFGSWNLGSETPRDLFGGRSSIKMVWDFVELNPFERMAGSWDMGVEAVIGVISNSATTSATPARVIRGNAQDLSFIPDATFDAVVVDPPYYDAFQYGDLSDYFYVWLKRSVGHLYPDLFLTPLTPKSSEVIENRADKKSNAYISSEEFEIRLTRAISELRRVVKPDGVISVVFAHTDSDAWERLLRALLQAELIVSTTWPMESERRGRSQANTSAVLGSSVVVVCRPRAALERGFYDDVVRELDARVAARLEEFEALGLTGADYLISAIGPAFEVFGKYTSVERLDGEAVPIAELLSLARRTVARHAMQRLMGAESLAAVDDLTLLYLTWRWAYGAASIPVDEAQKLGKAFHIEVDELGGMDGLAEKSRESYALRGPDERKRITLGAVPPMVDVLQLACQLHDSGRRRELAELLASSGFAEETAFWAAARAIAESLPDGNRERTMLVNLLGGREQVVAAAREAEPSEVLRLFEAGR